MAFLQKKPNVSTSVPLYTFSAHETYLIIGLGNPGEKYTGTRHNVGFTVIDKFAKDNGFPGWSEKKSLLCHLSVNRLGGKQVILAKPSTYMNNSGQAAAALQHFYKINNQSTLAVYDELAIEFGQLRTRIGGSDAGHNGVKSLISHIGPQFRRLRIGIASDESHAQDSADFVLKKFSASEKATLSLVINEAGVLMNEFVFGELAAQTRSVL